MTIAENKTNASTGGTLSREILALAAVVILGTSMTVLDPTIVNVAVPTLGSDLEFAGEAREAA